MVFVFPLLFFSLFVVAAAAVVFMKQNLYIPYWPGTCYLDQASLELRHHTSQKYW